MINYFSHTVGKMYSLKERIPVTTVVMFQFKGGFRPVLPNIFQILRVGVPYINLIPATHSSSVNRKIPPELNIQGEILSMRFMKTLRGICRSKKIKSFPNSIIMDVGSPERAISLKLSSTVEVTGARTLENAQEVLNTVIRHLQTAEAFLNKLYALVDEKGREHPETVEHINTYIQTHLIDRTPEYALDVINFFIERRERLYTGSLEYHPPITEMVNYQFRLPCSINLRRFAEIMNEHPFTTEYNPLGRPSVKVIYYYKKEGKEKQSKQIFLVGVTGSVMFTGPSSEQMDPVYNSFVRHFQENKDLLCNKGQIELRYSRSSGSFPIEVLLKEEERSRAYLTRLMAGELPCIEDLLQAKQMGTNVPVENEPLITAQESDVEICYFPYDTL